MDDMILKARLDEHTTVYVSPINARVYAQHMDEDNLGGEEGYFLLKFLKNGETERMEILAKAPTFNAAGELFDMIVSARRSA